MPKKSIYTKSTSNAKENVKLGEENYFHTMKYYFFARGIGLKYRGRKSCSTAARTASSIPVCQVEGNNF